MPKKKAKQSNKDNKTHSSIQQNNPSTWKFNEEERKKLKDFVIEKQNEKILLYAILVGDLAAIKAFSEKEFTIPDKNKLNSQFYENLLLHDILGIARESLNNSHLKEKRDVRV